jgi:hypothetical protein
MSVIYDNVEELLMTISATFESGAEMTYQFSVVLPKPSDRVD